MLIQDPRHCPGDLERWSHVERVASVNVTLKRYRGLVKRANEAIVSFTGCVSCYCGVSWGKDSVVVADMVQRICPRVPLVWVRVTPCENPDCYRVRDAFLKSRPHANYHEIEVKSPRDELGYLLRGTLEQGFAEAGRRFGARYISGIRGDESANRERRVGRYGECSKNTCAPIGRFDGADVFTYLLDNKLPIHPAYAFTMGGALDPQRIRVAVLGCRDTDREQGRRGDGWGRHEWEQMYYGEHIRQIKRQPNAHPAQSTEQRVDRAPLVRAGGVRTNSC